MKLKTVLFASAFVAVGVAAAVGVAQLRGSKSEFSPDTLEFRCSYFIYDEAFCYERTKVHSDLMELIKQYEQEGGRREAAGRWDLARGEKFRTRGWNGPAKDIAKRANDADLINWSAKNPRIASALWPRVIKLLEEQEYLVVKLLFDDIELIREDNIDPLIEDYRKMIEK